MKVEVNKMNCFNKIETIISMNKVVLYFGLKRTILTIVLLLSQVNESFAQTPCWTPHSSSPQYCAGAQVSYNNNNYENCFCVQGGVPSNSSAPSCSGYGAYWRLVGACSNCTNGSVNAGGNLSVCQGATSGGLGGSIGGGATGGTWTASSGTVNNATNVAGATYTANGATGNITLTLTTSGGCAAVQQSKTITVTALPTITGTTPASVCGSGTLALSATASAGTISWWAA